MEYKVGKLIAIQGGDGHVYTGIVTSVEDHDGTNDSATAVGRWATVDIIADGVYR
jgi:hypothetical protein